MLSFFPVSYVPAQPLLVTKMTGISLQSLYCTRQNRYKRESDDEAGKDKHINHYLILNETVSR